MENDSKSKQTRKNSFLPQSFTHLRTVIMSVHNELSDVQKKIDNDFCETGIDDALRYTRFFLRCIGIWPLVSTDSTRIERILSKFLMPYCSITMFIIVLPVYLHLTLRDVGITETILLLGPLCHTTLNIIEHLVLIFHSDLIKYCLQQMKTDLRVIDSENDWDIAMRNLNIGRKLSFMCAATMYGSGVFYIILKPIATGNTINEINETVRSLPFPGNNIILDLQTGYNYEMVICNNCIAGFFHCTVSNAVFNLAAIFVTHACGQIQKTVTIWANNIMLTYLQIVMSRLENLIVETDDITIKNRIAFIACRHDSILRFSSKIDQLLREICLMNVIAATIIICMLEYYCLLEWRNGNKVAVMTYGIIFTSVIFNMFIYCYAGELLKEQCEEIGKVAYMIDWYRLPGKTGLALVMIIIRSNNPPKLTAGRILELSITTFCDIVKTSFAYLGILQMVAED